jgi:hypothetical protein
MIIKMSFFTWYSLEEHLNSIRKPLKNLLFSKKCIPKTLTSIFFPHRVRYHDFQLYQINNETKHKTHNHNMKTTQDVIITFTKSTPKQDSKNSSHRQKHNTLQ